MVSRIRSSVAFLPPEEEPVLPPVVAVPVLLEPEPVEEPEEPPPVARPGMRASILRPPWLLLGR